MSVLALPESEPLAVQKELREGKPQRGGWRHADSRKTVELTLVLKPKRNSQSSIVTRKLIAQSPWDRQYETWQTCDSRFAPEPGVVKRLAAFAKKNRLKIATGPGAQLMRLSGSVGDINNALGVKLWVSPNGRYTCHFGPVHLPMDLHGEIEAVHGLDTRPRTVPHLYMRTDTDSETYFMPEEVAKYYGFPAPREKRGEDKNGKKQRIAIISNRGGYYDEDIHYYFEKIAGLKAPKITNREIGARNNPADSEKLRQFLVNQGLTIETIDRRAALQEVLKERESESNTVLNLKFTIEVTLDIELCGAFAPAADIFVYFCPNEPQRQAEAIEAAAAEGADVIFTCWGRTETSWSGLDKATMEFALEKALQSGVTVVCSAGDNGLLEYPGSSPYVLSCGGSSLRRKGGGPGLAGDFQETVWAESARIPVCQRLSTGGGVTRYFGRIEWQQSADVLHKTGMDGRGVPDVAGKADLFDAGYLAYVGGVKIGVGGTSSVAPMWAALIATLNADLGTRLGFVNPTLYGNNSASGFNSITEGDNGPFEATDGWDPCTGLGSPKYAELKRLFQQVTAVGTAAGR